MVSEKELTKQVQKREKETVNLLKKLIQAKTVNPPGNEYKAAKIVEKELKKSKIKYKKYEKMKGRTNLVAEIGKGKAELLIACHLDTVPAGDGWKTNPFKGVVKKGKVFGRGAQDNKGAVASTIILGKILKKFEKEFHSKLLLVFAADEELGSKYGTTFLMKEKKIFATNAIIPDIADNLKTIAIGEKGGVFFKITSYGKQVHGSRPWLGENAIENMMLFLKKLKQLKIPYKKHKHFTKPTINIGAIKGGSAPNMVPSVCEAKVDMRFVPRQNVDKAIKKIKQLAKKTQGKFKIEIMVKLKPHVVDEKSELVKVLKKNIKKVTGKNPKLRGLEGGTVAKDMVPKINAIDVGIGDDVAHQPNEYIQISQLKKFEKTMALVAKEMLID